MFVFSLEGFHVLLPLRNSREAFPTIYAQSRGKLGHGFPSQER